MRRSTKILGVIAVVMIGLGGYGVYHASGVGGREIVDGTVVELKEHIGERPICVRNGRRSRRCLTPNATEPYGYATEVVEYTGPDGQPVRAEDPRERGGAREAVGDEVKVILHPDGSVEITPKDSMLVSGGLLAGGVALLGLLVLRERWRRRDPADEARADPRGAGETAVPVELRWPLWQVVTALGVLTMLSAGVTVVVLRQTENDYPKEWDPRVVELADFVQRERGALYEHPVPVDFLSPEEYSKRTRTEEGTLSDDDKAELEQFEGTMRALGLLAADVDLFKVTNDLVDTGTLAYLRQRRESGRGAGHRGHPRRGRHPRPRADPRSPGPDLRARPLRRQGGRGHQWPDLRFRRPRRGGRRPHRGALPGHPRPGHQGRHRRRERRRPGRLRGRRHPHRPDVALRLPLRVGGRVPGGVEGDQGPVGRRRLLQAAHHRGADPRPLRVPRRPRSRPCQKARSRTEPRPTTRATSGRSPS